MLLVFRKGCKCHLSDKAFLPKLNLKTKAPSRIKPAASVDIDFKCPVCGKSWIASVSVIGPGIFKRKLEYKVNP